MEKLRNEIVLNYTDQHINNLLNKQKQNPEEKNENHENRAGIYYNQNEELFIKLKEPITIPSFPIHHDITITVPNKHYLETLRSIIEQITALYPYLFNGLTYFFDPTEIFHPNLFQVFKTKEEYYLYLIRLDLHYRTHECSIIEKGGNDNTHAFSTQNLHLESDMIPLQGMDMDNSTIRTFYINQYVSQTWIGETGRGYVVSGIWMDTELTKFFSKLFLPQNKRAYPYYPFMCKYRTISHSVLNIDLEGRKKHLAYLHNAVKFLSPRMAGIEKALKHTPFSMDLPEFKKIKNEVSTHWNTVWEPLRVKPYLNELDMKEFAVEFNPQ